jgi:hypothetical protein
MRGRLGNGGQDTRVGASGARPPTIATGGNRQRRALLLLVTGVWLALAGLALSGAAASAAASPLTSFAGPASTVTPTPGTATPTPTYTPHPGATATPSVSPTVTVTTTPSVTPTSPPPTPTDTPYGGGGDIGPQPTKVVSQLPSAGGGGGGTFGGLSPGAIGSNGLLLATTSSCIVSLLGLLIAAIALSVLLRGGYGPFLKALLRGKRAGRKGAGAGSLAGASASKMGNRFGFGDGPNDDDGWSEPRWSRDDFDNNDWPAPRGSGADFDVRRGGSSRSRSRGVSRDDW